MGPEKGPFFIEAIIKKATVMEMKWLCMRKFNSTYINHRLMGD
jgi:hypothetical protein